MIARIFHPLRRILPTLLALSTGTADAQTKQVLFDGKTLTGWHTQGEGVWTVADGLIHARNPKKNWAHLVTDQTYKNGYVRMRFLNQGGNSGLYVRGAESGIYGVKGMQVDIGAPHNDGSVMRVTDSTYTWFAQITKAVDSGWLKTDGWNELAVDVQGSDLRTYVNGKLIWSGTNVAGIAATGVLALQLHSGDDNDIYYKDLEVLLPTRVPHCPDPANPAYKPGNDPDSSLCKTVGLYVGETPAREGRRSGARLWITGGADAFGRGQSGGVESNGSATDQTLFDLRGARLPAFPVPLQENRK